MSTFQASNETVAPLDIYVAAAAANAADDNNGDASTPLATLGQAFSRIPKNVRHPVRIHVGLTAAPGYDWGLLTGKTLKGASIYIIGDGGGQGVDDGFTVDIATAAATGGSVSTVVNAGGGYGVNALQGLTVDVITGLAAGDRRTIRSNDATTIIPTAPFTGAVGAGDLFRVVSPNVIVDLDLPVAAGLTNLIDGIAGEGEAAAVHLVNLRFDSGTAVAGRVLSANAAPVSFIGVEIYTGGVCRVSRGEFSTSVFDPTDLGASITATRYLGWGLAKPITDNTNAGLQLEGATDTDNATIFAVVDAAIVSRGSNLSFSGVRCYGNTAVRAGLVVERRSYVQLVSGSVGGHFFDTLAAAGDGISVESGSYLKTLATLTVGGFAGTTPGNALHASANSTIELVSLLTVGTTVTGFVLSAVTGGTIFAPQASFAAWAGQGTAGDTVVLTANVAVAAYVSVGFASVNGQSVIQAT